MAFVIPTTISGSLTSHVTATATDTPTRYETAAIETPARKRPAKSALGATGNERNFR